MGELRRCLGVSLMAVVLAGCTREEVLFEIPLEEDRLVLHERFRRGFDTDLLELELRYVTREGVRVVSPLRIDTPPLYRDPGPDEPYQHFRGGGPPDPWPVFVDSREFTLEEFHRFRIALEGNLHRMDRALEARALDGSPQGHPRRRPFLSSIRYVDLSAFERTYACFEDPFPVEIHVDRSGNITVRVDTPRRAVSSMGVVVNNGLDAVLPPPGAYEPILMDHREWLAEALRDRRAFAAMCRDAHGRTLLDDFAVRVSPDLETYRVEGVGAWVRRRDSRREAAR